MKVKFLVIPYLREEIDEVTEGYDIKLDRYTKETRKGKITSYDINNHEVFEYEGGIISIFKKDGFVVMLFIYPILALLASFVIGFIIFIFRANIHIVYLNICKWVFIILSPIFIAALITQGKDEIIFNLRAKLILENGIDIRKCEVFEESKWNKIILSNSDGIINEIKTDKIIEERISFCSNCKKTVPTDSSAGHRCPHCNAIWSTEKKLSGVLISVSRNHKICSNCSSHVLSHSSVGQICPFCRAVWTRESILW